MKAAFAAVDDNNSVSPQAIHRSVLCLVLRFLRHILTDCLCLQGSLDAGEAGAVAKKLDKDLTPAELAQMMRDLDTVSPQAIRRCL